MTPAGNSVSVTNLLYLAKALDKPEYVERARQCMASAAPVIQENPAAGPQLAIGLARLLDVQPAIKSPAAK